MGGAFNKQDSLFVISWNSIVASQYGASGFGKRFVFTIVKKSAMTENTLPELWKILAWSFNSMLTGIHPEIDWNRIPLEGGTYLADQYMASCIQLRGDWEFYANALGFQHWTTCIRVCWQCLASNVVAERRWHDFGVGAGWRGTRLRDSTYARVTGGPLPMIVRLILGFNLACVCVDVLHCVDLGVCAHVIANIF